MVVVSKTNLHDNLNHERAQLEKIANLPIDKSKEPAFKDMKFDNDKQLAGVLFEDFPNALSAVIEIATFGANKYKRNSWRTVSNGMQRYTDAMVRHQLAIGRGEVYDPESNLLHHAHFAWNALATLELLLRGYDGFEGRSVSRPSVLPDDYRSSTIVHGIGERHIIGEQH